MPVLCHRHSQALQASLSTRVNSESAVRFPIEWISDRKAVEYRYLTGQAERDSASLITTSGYDVIFYVAIL